MQNKLFRVLKTDWKRMVSKFQKQLFLSLNTFQKYDILDICYGFFESQKQSQQKLFFSLKNSFFPVSKQHKNVTFLIIFTVFLVSNTVSRRVVLRLQNNCFWLLTVLKIAVFYPRNPNILGTIRRTRTFWYHRQRQRQRQTETDRQSLAY